MWQAPEVIEHSRNCSKAGDVYSFGIIMFELLMLNRPWPGTPLPLISHYVKVLCPSHLLVSFCWSHSCAFCVRHENVIQAVVIDA